MIWVYIVELHSYTVYTRNISLLGSDSKAEIIVMNSHAGMYFIFKIFLLSLLSSTNKAKLRPTPYAEYHCFLLT